MSSSSPDRLVETLVAGWPAAAIRAAIELDLFTILGRRRLTAPGLARRMRVETARVARLCDYLAAAGWLHKRTGAYEAARDAARYLDARSPESVAGAVRWFLGDDMAAALRTLGSRRRRRAPARGPSADVWRRFARETFALRALYAAPMADALEARGVLGPRILDVGAGASPLGLALVQRRTDARLTVQDRAEVVPVALARARDAGVRRRVTAIRGDALTAPLGGPYDLALLVNVLDYVPVRDRPRLLARIRTALAPGGAIAIGGPLFDRRRTGPPEASAYDFLLLALGADGRPSTFEELTGQLRAAGFGRAARVPGTSLVIAVRQEKT